MEGQSCRKIMKTKEFFNEASKMEKSYQDLIRRRKSPYPPVGTFPLKRKGRSKNHSSYHTKSTMLFPPCYPAWEMMEGENVKASAKTFTSPLPKAAHPFRPFVGTCAAAIKALTNLSDIRSKPWVFVTFGPSQK